MKKIINPKRSQYDFFVFTSSLKKKIQRIVSATTNRINREKDEEKRHKLKIIKREFSKLADEL